MLNQIASNILLCCHEYPHDCRIPSSAEVLVSLIDCFVVQLSQVFMLRVFHIGTIC